MTGTRRHTADPDSPQQLAWLAAETVQALARSTRTGHRDPNEAYQMITALAAASAALGQLLHQTRAWLRAGHRAGTLAADDGGDTDQLTAATAYCLRDARQQASCLSVLLDTAAQHLALLTTRTPS